MKKQVGIALLGWTIVGATYAADDAVLQHAMQQAQQKMHEGRSDQAYAILAPYEYTQAGQVGFDYLFGQVAAAASHPSQAAFAFERCLAVDPQQGECRLGMIHAHLMLNELDSAGKEITLVSESSPPKEVRDILRNYQEVLTGLSEANDPRWQSYAEFGIGYDSNFNAATAQGSIALPLFNNLVFDLASDGKSRESGFNQMQMNVAYTRPVNPSWKLLLEGNVYGSGYWATHDYNALITDAKVGVTYQQGAHQVGVKLQGQHYRLGNQAYRNMTGMIAQYDYAVSERTRVGTYVQANQLTYPGNELRKANRYLAGATLSRMIGSNTLAYLSILGGKELASSSEASRTFDYQFGGFRLGGLLLLSSAMRLEAGAGVERRLYDGREVLFMRSRNDNIYDAFLSLNYALTKKTSIKTQYRYMRGVSSIPLQDYKRDIFTVSVRYDF